MKSCWLIVFYLLCCVCAPSYAQVLDDLETPKPSSHKTVEDSEELFNELFNEFPPDERDIGKPAEFDDAISEAADTIKSYSNYVTQSEVSEEKNTVEFSPLNSDIKLSFVKGNYKIFKNLAGRLQCRFSIKLKSEIDRDINVIGLSLAYPKMSFAFIFRNVPPNGELVKNITTGGDICYNLDVSPDIHVNKCKIKNTKSDDCVSHIKWDDGKQKGL